MDNEKLSLPEYDIPEVIQNAVERQDSACQREQIPRQNQRTDTVHTGGRDGLEGNPVAFDQRFFYATFAAHPQRLHVRNLRREYVVHGEGGIHSSARSPGANQQSHRMTSYRLLPYWHSRRSGARCSE